MKKDAGRISFEFSQDGIEISFSIPGDSVSRYDSSPFETAISLIRLIQEKNAPKAEEVTD